MTGNLPCDRPDHIALIPINRPQALNALRPISSLPFER